MAQRNVLFRRTDAVAIEGIADMPGASRTSGCDATDPIRSLTEAKCRTAVSPWPDPNPLCCHRLGAADAFRSANETPVHHAARRRGGLAARGGCAAAGDAANRCAPARRRGQYAISDLGGGVPTGARAIGLEHRPQRAD